MKKHSQILIMVLIMASTVASGAIKGQGGTGVSINDIRNFQIDQNTVIKEDGQVIPEIRGQGGTGFKVRYRIASDVNPEVTTGTIEEIDLINTHKGPVTSLDPFRIFNVDALLTANTFFEDNLTFEQISVGDELKLSGFVDSNSTLIVSRVEADDEPLDEWKVSGYVSGLNATQFSIQNQVVIIGGVIPNDCDTGLADGLFVEVEATPDAMFMAGSPLNTVTKIECKPEGITTLPGDVIPVALEGIVDFEDIELNNLFTIAGQPITVGGATVYINGEVDDIVIGAKVEVEGLMNTTTSLIDALKVKFKEVRFKFEEPVLPSDVTTGESITLFGKTIFSTPQLRDEDGIMGSGLGVETQVEVRGYADSEGNLYATRVRERGNPDVNEANADGFITAINNPQIEIFGVVVDTSTSVFFDINGMPISSADFFNQIAVGTEVEVEDAFINETTNVISGGIIRIDEDDDFTRVSSIKAGATQALGVGTITGLPDVIFADSFE
ncbi:DUF5666 domain-containing protein [Marinicella sp. S1101]|uniref:DUF5666 domain-containing protein n=1 Tax=Marinicella marina TaxID=2996016 RepID=UPI002260C755|nr:DUF5666 domain-containing protein [Marinicella marina]MCX7553399.1 DUF5666 domain-containing protein [Marinicella marina]MDJ1140022.1 DUF5666 domain-containing protein [Marinicella marina]